MAGLDLWAAHGDDIVTFLVYTGGILVYTLLAAACYTFLSRRDMFGSKPSKDAVTGLAVGFGYVAIFPLMGFAFFLLLAASLLFFNTDMDPRKAFNIAMAIVAAVRILAYITETTAHELAKLMPFGLLGVFLVLNDYSGLRDSFSAMRAIVDEWELIGVFFAIVVVMEFLMRGLYLGGRAAGRATRRGRATGSPAVRAAPPKGTVAFRKA